MKRFYSRASARRSHRARRCSSANNVVPRKARKPKWSETNLRSAGFHPTAFHPAHRWHLWSARYLNDVQCAALNPIHQILVDIFLQSKCYSLSILHAATSCVSPLVLQMLSITWASRSSIWAPHSSNSFPRLLGNLLLTFQLTSAYRRRYL